MKRNAIFGVLSSKHTRYILITLVDSCIFLYGHKSLDHNFAKRMERNHQCVGPTRLNSCTFIVFCVVPRITLLKGLNEFKI